MKHSVRLAALLLLAAGTAHGAGEPAAPGLVLEDCRISAGPGYPSVKARCGRLARPLDPADPGSESIELAVAVVPALSLEPAPTPLVPIAGGPGQSTIEFYAAYSAAFEPIRRNRDIVLLDQRGTGKSAPLTCGLDEELVEGDISPERAAKDARECLAELRHDPRFFTTSVAVTDLEAVRQALGVPAFNLYGISYGTRVAQHYVRQYPDSTRTVILDGVVPPQVALGPAIAIEAQKALERIFSRCAESPECDERFPAIAHEFRLLQSQLAESPVEIELPHPVTAHREALIFGSAQLAGALRILSYHPNTVALMPLLIDEAFDGNYAPIAAQYLMTARSVAEALAIGMHNAVVCTEDAPFFESENVTREALESTYIGPVQLEALTAMCEVWPQGVRDENLRTPLATDTPVLLLSGGDDPITPPEFAELAAVSMTNHKFLTGRDQGHGQLTRTCIPEAMANFVERASFGWYEEAKKCVKRRQFAMPFFLDFTGPAP